MKKYVVLFLPILFFIQSCALNSTTYIDANKSFVLGKGKHGSYSAKVENAGKTNVQVFQIIEDLAPVSLGVLSSGEKATYPVKRNTTIRFENEGNETAKIKIKAKGDTNLSMGYVENE